MPDIREKYFKYLRETSSKVKLEIQGSFSDIKKNKNIYPIFETLIIKRLQHNQLRSTITRLSYEICGGKDWKKIFPACAVMELHTMYAYWHNWIFDNKNNIWDGKIEDIRVRVNNTIICAAITRELAFKEIDKLDINNEQKQKIQKSFSNSTLELYEGQYIDVNLLIDSFGSFKDETDFLRIYEHKSDLESGSSYGFSGYTCHAIYFDSYLK